MWVHNLDPVIAHLGPFQIRWYGVMYALSFLITYYYAKKAIKNEKLNLTLEQLDKLMFWLVIALLVGARLFIVLIYEPAYYFSNPLKILAIWEGGLSFHGGLLLMLLTAYYFARKHQISFWQLADVFIVPLSLGQALGRIGNFINGELYGRITDVFWAVKFPAVEGFRHPSPLYEAFYDIVIFGILFSIRNKKLPQGTSIALFLILYAVFRSVAEFFREPDYYIGPLTVGQFLNVFVLIAGIGLLYWTRKKKETF